MRATSKSNKEEALSTAINEVRSATSLFVVIAILHVNLIEQHAQLPYCVNTCHVDENLCYIDLQVGPCYGRRMLKGYMLSKGVAISDRHLRSALPYIAPIQHLQRQLGRTNPHLYRADYHGQKLHLDQNEKLSMYGVTYVLARDGYSSKITAGAVLDMVFGTKHVLIMEENSI